MKEVEETPKLRMMKSSCAMVKRKKERTMLMKLRGGTAPFQIEVAIGRWQGVNREERVCIECLGPPQAAFDDRSQPLG